MTALRIAYQGEPGAFSEEAVTTLQARDELIPVPYRTFSQVVDALEAGQVVAALLPVENSIAGSVTPSLDLLAERELTVRREVVRPIVHCLLAPEGTVLEDLHKVISHPVALAQCTRFLQENEGLEAIAVHDTAGAAREVAQEGAGGGVAAIASPWAAERYGLTCLLEGIQDRQDNRTRFWLVTRRGEADPLGSTPKSNANRLALMLETRDLPGALLATLEPFARENLSLRRIESRPSEKPWSYRFFMEVAGAPDDPGMLRALEALVGVTSTLKVLGTFQGSPEG
ncbi:MAG: prephenate dehydratase [Gemmatimonadota bacterium]